MVRETPLKIITILLVVMLLAGISLVKILERKRNSELVEDIKSIEIYDIRVIKIAKLVNWKPENCIVIHDRSKVLGIMEELKQVLPGGVDKEGTVSVERVFSIETDYGSYSYLATIYDQFPEQIVLTPDIYKVKKNSGYALIFSGKEASLIDKSGWYLNFLRSSNCL